MSMLFILLTSLSAGAAGYDLDRLGNAAAPPQTVSTQAVFEQDIPAEWSALFQSPQIDAFIKRAFITYPNAEAVQVALRQAQNFSVVQQGFFYPSVAEGNLLSRNMPAVSKFSNSPGQKGSSPRYDIRIAQLTVGYVPDMLGSKHSQSESPQFQAGMQREASYFTLASNVAAAAIEEAVLRAQIEAQLNIVGFNRQSMEIAHNQVMLGYVSEEEEMRRGVEAALAQQALVPLQQQLEQVRELLHVLAGNSPDEDITEKIMIEEIHLSRELPLSLSSGLVEQRPDVRIAKARLNAVGTQYGVAVVNMLPRFTVAGTSGGVGASSKWMLKSGGRFFDLKGNVAQSVFDARALRSKSRAIQQVLGQAAAQYRNVTMVALQDVANILNVIVSDEQGFKSTAKLAQAASKTGELTRKQYEAGAVDFQTLLVAQQNEQFAAISLAQAQSNRAGDAIALYQALGGRWWKRDSTVLTGAKQP